MEEVWKDIKGFDGYKISNYGRVKSLPKSGLGGHSYDIIMSPNVDKDGYLLIHLHNNKRRYIRKVHRLVAEAFIPNPDNLPVINHIDENKANNLVTNLEWCTMGYNNSFGNGNKSRTKNKSKKVLQYTLGGEFVKEWESTMAIQRALGLFRSNISLCCQGKYQQAYGYKWRYKVL